MRDICDRRQTVRVSASNIQESEAAMVSWWKFSEDVMLAGWEAQRVVALRMLKLSQGGPAAASEASLMISEKARASFETATTLMGGGSPEKVLRRYRTIMRANEKRLSRTRSCCGGNSARAK